MQTLPMVMFFNGDKEPLFTTPVSMAPMRVQMFQQQLALHSAPRCILPEAGEKLPLASEIVRLHRVTFTWCALASQPGGRVCLRVGRLRARHTVQQRTALD
jgi:hypothetical protein